MSLFNRHIDEQTEFDWDNVPPKNVCFRCIGNEDLGIYIGRHARFKTCDYCKTKSKNNISISLKQLIIYIQKSLRSEYEEPYDAGAVFDDETGEWFDAVYDSYDMVREIECIETDDDNLLNDISNSLTGWSYCVPHEEYVHNRILAIQWDEFTDMIKHKLRFMFYHPECSLLKKVNFKYRDILKIIEKFIVDKNFIVELDTNQVINRVRLSNKPFSVEHENAKNLGTVPDTLACWDNRMSPAGIPMFYGADNLQTAIQETYPVCKNYYSLGRFVPSKKIYLVDFTKKFDVPSIYHEKIRHERHIYGFMANFIGSLTQPIKKDKKEDIINYIPTQVIAEYIRYVLVYKDNKIDGLIYNSSIPGCSSSNCYALFVDNQHCIDLGETQDSDELYLILTAQDHGAISDIISVEELRTANTENSESV